MIRKLEIYDCTCDREGCGHSWQTRKAEYPNQCPKCKSWKWNLATIKKVQKEGKKAKAKEIADANEFYDSKAVDVAIEASQKQTFAKKCCIHILNDHKVLGDLSCTKCDCKKYFREK